MSGYTFCYIVNEKLSSVSCGRETARRMLQLRRYNLVEICQVGVFEGDGSLIAQISDGRGVAHKPLLVSEN